MPRQNDKDEKLRRKLRTVYDRNRRRVQRVGDARDRNRKDGEERAPRQFMVTERQTRREGFGRGGVQARRVTRRRNENKSGDRFQDRAVFRRGGGGQRRFERDDDRDRERRRFRRRGVGNGNNNNNSNNGNGNRKNDRRNRLADRRRKNESREQRRKNNKPADLDEQLNRYKGGNNNNKGNNNGNGNSKRGGNNNKRGPVTHEDLDKQLESFKASIAQTQATVAALAPTI